jgi:hypothetical protein
LTDQHLLTLEHFFGWGAQLSIVFRLSLSFFILGPQPGWPGPGRCGCNILEIPRIPVPDGDRDQTNPFRFFL